MQRTYVTKRIPQGTILVLAGVVLAGAIGAVAAIGIGGVGLQECVGDALPAGLSNPNKDHNDAGKPQHI